MRRWRVLDPRDRSWRWVVQNKVKLVLMESGGFSPTTYSRVILFLQQRLKEPVVNVV